MLKIITALLLLLFNGKSYGVGLCAIDEALHKAQPSGLVVTSAHRTPEHNKRVGGVKNSHHLKPCRARDILLSSIKDKKEFIRIMNKLGYRVLTNYKNHYHVDIGIN